MAIDRLKPITCDQIYHRLSLTIYILPHCLPYSWFGSVLLYVDYLFQLDALCPAVEAFALGLETLPGTEAFEKAVLVSIQVYSKDWWCLLGFPLGVPWCILGDIWVVASLTKISHSPYTLRHDECSSGTPMHIAGKLGKMTHLFLLEN